MSPRTSGVVGAGQRSNGLAHVAVRVLQEAFGDPRYRPGPRPRT